MCLLAALNITINLCLTMYFGIIGVRLKIATSINERALKRKIDQKIQNRMKMVELAHPMFKEWENEI